MRKIREQIYQDLRKLGLADSYYGEKFLYLALEIIQEEPTRLCCISKQIYPEIAKQYDTNIVCVERNLRTFISKLWETGHYEYFEKLAGKTLNKKPSNGEFLDIMSMYLENVDEQELLKLNIDFIGDTVSVHKIRAILERDSVLFLIKRIMC